MEHGNMSKKFLILALVAIVVSSVVYFSVKKYTTLPAVETPPVVQEKKVYTEAEKKEILIQLSQSRPGDTASPLEKERSLENLSMPIPTTTISNEEKQRVLEALMSTQGQ